MISITWMAKFNPVICVLHPPIHIWDTISKLLDRGGALKKELSNVTSVFIELPQNHPLGTTLGGYKTRFEEYMDEFLEFAKISMLQY